MRIGYTNRQKSADFMPRAIIRLFLIPLLLLSAEAVYSQIEVQGVVSDETNEPLIGVNILVKGTDKGTSTDFDGKFSLTNVDESAVLILTYLGYRTQELPVTASTMYITMSSDAQMLDEVVVTALGIKRQAKELGYSVGELKGEDLTQTGQTNFLNSMSGKIPGAKIRQMDGAMGSTVNVIIRGANSLTGDNQPLFVIDGVPVMNQLNNSFQGADLGNAISDINPNDIENISVLKGPSASALYGSRAANGVVLITTKGGSEKGFGVALNSSYVNSFPIHYFPFQTRFGSGKDGAHVFQEGENESWGQELDVGNMAVQWNSEGEEIPLVSYPNRLKDFFRNGASYTNDLSVSHNDDKSSIRLSASDVRTEGLIPNTNLKRNTFSLNGTYHITPKLSVSGYFNWNNSRSDNRPNIDGDDRNDIVRSLYEKGAQVNILDLKDYWEPGMEGIQQRVNAPKQNNAWMVAYENTNAFNRDRLISKGQIDWEILPSLRFMGRITRDAYGEEREAKKAFSTQSSPNGQYQTMSLKREEINIESHFSYEKDINEEWSLRALAGGNKMYRYGKTLDNIASSLIIPELYTISNGVPGTIEYNSSWNQKGIYSLFGSADVGYKDLLFLNLTARNDWSSTLPKENRSFFYPSASLSAMVSQMMTLPEWITFMKLRGGIAEAGNDTEPYQLLQYFSTASDWGAAKQLYMEGVLQNPSLMPESQISKEVGMDLRLFDSNVGLNVTYYVSDNKNQILGIDIPIESGASSRIINAGLVQSKGWEIGLDFSVIDKRDLNVDLALNFTKNKTWVKELAPGLDNFSHYSKSNAYLRTYVGDLRGDIWIEPMLTVTDEESPYYGYPLLTGDGRYQTDKNPDHLVKAGNSNPDFQLGIQPSVNFKRFSLTANIDWSQGGQFYSQTNMFLSNNGILESTFSGVPYDRNQDITEQIKNNPEKFFGEWVGGRTEDLGGFEWPGETGRGRLNDASFNVGVRQVVDNNGNVTYQENLGGEGTIWLNPFTAHQKAKRELPVKNIFDATFVKVREIALLYHLPTSALGKLNVQKASFGIIANNIYEWTKAGIDVDPERAYMMSGGGWIEGFEYYNVMPWVGSLGVKLNINF